MSGAPTFVEQVRATTLAAIPLKDVMREHRLDDGKWYTCVPMTDAARALAAEKAKVARLREALSFMLMDHEDGWCETCKPARKALADTADTAEAAEPCTGKEATWCPVHGTCTCEMDTDGESRTLSDSDCPLHGFESAHAEADR